MVVLANATLAKAEAVMSKVYPDYKKFFKYLAVGAIATAVNMSAYALLIRYTLLSYLIASIIAYHAGMAFSFYLNRRFTFQSAYEKVHYQLASFALVAYTQLLIVELVLLLVVELVFGGGDDLHQMIGYGIAIVVGFIYAFFANSRLTFSRFK